MVRLAPTRDVTRDNLNRASEAEFVGVCIERTEIMKCVVTLAVLTVNEWID